jgi:hypothetical protein
MIKEDYGVTAKQTTVRNPQANAIVEPSDWKYYPNI